ncbi:NAD-dependent epimerase/dehydratase family protein [Jatrophihabitans sp. GAS493]|uniref:NAD-dependent epimerase/dehydratase family protein n=1 Tax=Jatrophihabitans sp. GAS493 TaxID=1907575 RepID=UPI000BC07F5D|nr:NAD(P)-dependent oxidoreductase [Jatrophihabitans sp. GAS493]SOD72011.1 NAD-dependent epimerase/dehydratase family protein [Jatrophihabitans sp. GAS493]
MTVLLTGSSGRLGTMLRQRLGASGWDLRLLDLVPHSPDDSETIIADVADPTALDAALADGAVEAIVHLGGQPTEAVWERIRSANFEGVYQLFEAARRAGVSRVVYASSNHAVGFTPRGDASPAAALAVAGAGRPDTLYGVSKIFGEALGRYYVERYGMTVSCLRIGTCDWTPPDHRALSTWLSPDDFTRLVDAALRTEVDYSVVWGVSANTRRWWSLEEGFAIGYRPVDDAEAFASQLTESPAFASDDLVGGGFTTTGFGIDEVRARG